MKKKIAIISSIGGGGHVAVSGALKEVLDPDYSVVVNIMLQEILAPVDWIQQASFGHSSGEQMYNYFIKRRAYRLLNAMAWISHYFFGSFTKKISHLINNYLDKTKPDLVISVAPYFNGYLAEATQARFIPFILIPTDLDATTFVQGIDNTHHPLRHIALSFNDPEIKKRAHVKHHPLITGFPVRKEFFTHDQNKEQIKKDFNIPAYKPVILILMGAQGSQSTLDFARELAHLTQPAHLIFCLGKNETIQGQIETIPFLPHLSHTCVGFTPRMADLMAISDCIITKSGSVSVCEALYMNLPLILDATGGPVLKWEAFNHRFIPEHGFGHSLKKLSDLTPLIDQLLIDNQLPVIRQTIAAYEKKEALPEIKKLIDRLLGN